MQTRIRGVRTVKMGVPAVAIGDVAREMAAKLLSVQEDAHLRVPTVSARESAHYGMLRAPSLELIEKR